jgi:hypothetical protein
MRGNIPRVWSIHKKEQDSALRGLLPWNQGDIISTMTEKNKEPRTSKKKPYQKPKVKSAKFYERKALACAKEEGSGNPECAAGFYS